MSISTGVRVGITSSLTLLFFFVVVASTYAQTDEAANLVCAQETARRAALKPPQPPPPNPPFPCQAMTPVGPVLGTCMATRCQAVNAPGLNGSTNMLDSGLRMLGQLVGQLAQQLMQGQQSGGGGDSGGGSGGGAQGCTSYTQTSDQNVAMSNPCTYYVPSVSGQINGGLTGGSTGGTSVSDLMNALNGTSGSGSTGTITSGTPLPNALTNSGTPVSDQISGVSSGNVTNGSSNAIISGGGTNIGQVIPTSVPGGYITPVGDQLGNGIQTGTTNGSNFFIGNLPSGDLYSSSGQSPLTSPGGAYSSGQNTPTYSSSGQNPLTSSSGSEGWGAPSGSLSSGQGYSWFADVNDSNISSITFETPLTRLGQSGTVVGGPRTGQSTVDTSTPQGIVRAVIQKELPPGVYGNILVREDGSTILAGYREAQSEVAGFYGSGSGTVKGTSAVARICEKRPWSSNLLSYIIPPSFFDGLCSWRGYAVGPSSTVQTPTTGVQTGGLGTRTNTIIRTEVRYATTTATTTPQAPSGRVDIWASPATVPIGARTSIFWTSENVAGCIVTSPDGSFNHTSPRGGASTVPLTAQTVFTISCVRGDGTPLTDNVTVYMGI